MFARKVLSTISGKQQMVNVNNYHLIPLHDVFIILLISP